MYYVHIAMQGKDKMEYFNILLHTSIEYFNPILYGPLNHVNFGGTNSSLSQLFSPALYIPTLKISVKLRLKRKG